jgi:hypothetical protein
MGNEPPIALKPLKSPICSGDSLPVTFQKFGNFNAGNQFQIQVTSDCCDYKTLATVSDAGKYTASSFTNGTRSRGFHFACDVQRDPDFRHTVAA